jgi:hypothetical protein
MGALEAPILISEAGRKSPIGIEERLKADSSLTTPKLNDVWGPVLSE